eukprot:4481794-Amphidinium_carterae.1
MEQVCLWFQKKSRAPVVEGRWGKCQFQTSLPLMIAVKKYSRYKCKLLSSRSRSCSAHSNNEALACEPASFRL